MQKEVLGKFGNFEETRKKKTSELLEVFHGLITLGLKDTNRQSFSSLPQNQ
jgi:hypothetical protein